VNDGDLRWTAERYVLGDLSDADAERFESLLADSQAAREAVAEAVSLCEMTAAAVRTPARRPIPAAWLGASAACLLVVAAVVFAPRNTELADATPKKAIETSVNDEWILALPELLEIQTAMHQADGEEEAGLLESVVGVVDESDDLPEWLITVTGSKEGSP
jgi:hypothetical protein